MIEGADWSRWQSNPDCAKFKARGGRFLGIKVSQDIDIRDSEAQENNDAAHAQGILTFPYHFVGLGAPTAQYNWFIQCLGSMKFDLAPALDFEPFNPVTMEPFYELRDMNFNSREGDVSLGYNRMLQEYGLVIPSASTVYAIASKLKGWQSRPFPAIYSNLSTFNSKCINTSIYQWSQFLCWLAAWNVTTPAIPTAWKGKSLYIWQDRVIKGAGDWGVSGDMDHDFWMDAMPFPGDVPAPESMQWRGLIGGEWWCGEIKKERC